MFRLESPVLAQGRQAALYCLLLSRGDKWTPLREIAQKMEGYYPDFPFRGFHNSTCRRWITKDIQAINDSPEYEKIILSGSRGVKIATEEEFDRFIAAEYKEIFRKLMRVRRIAKKGGADRQIDIEGQIREAFVEVRKDG